MAHQLLLKPRFGTQSRALIVEGYATARSVLAAQLRQLGVQQVMQCSRAHEMRDHMRSHQFDVLVVAQSLADGTTGQELIDEARRNGWLSLSTVVLMVSADATYQVVAQVAESALDGFVIKPYTVGQLEDRVMRAFARKESLRAILDAVDERDYAQALVLCEMRFAGRGPHWTSAARIGAELALRLQQLSLAQTFFDAVIHDRAVPWAKLGLARTLEAADKAGEALSTLANLVSSEPTYADAYDVMGRIHAEQGNFSAAIAAYKQAATITPHSVQRAQKYGILAHYAGEPAEALAALQRAVTVGLNAPQFDHQALLLLSIGHFRGRDADALRQCCEQLDTALAHSALVKPAAPATVGTATGGAPAAPPAEPPPTETTVVRRERLRRMAELAHGFDRLLAEDHPRAEEHAANIAQGLETPPFDAEAASNLLSLVSAADAAGAPMAQAAEWARRAGLRFCVSKHATELLARACEASPFLAEQVRTTHAEISEATRAALSEGLAGRHHQAVDTLLSWGERTLNAKLLEVAEATLARYREHLEQDPEACAALAERAQTLRERCGKALRDRLAADAPPQAQPGGMWLP